MWYRDWGSDARTGAFSKMPRLTTTPPRLNQEVGLRGMMVWSTFTGYHLIMEHLSTMLLR